jgi:ubiquinone biosynthesis protein COQ4
MRELVEHPDRTYLAFDINEALDPEMPERQLARMLAEPSGRRIFRESSSLQRHLDDPHALAALPEGSFGRAYLEHLERHGLTPSKLVELGDEVERRAAHIDPDLRWLRQRMGMPHDLWHVLPGSGADGTGEAPLLLFSLGQAGGRANLLLSFGANLRVLLERGPRWIPYAWTAWRRGRRAKCLAALPYEELLAKPLAEVREAAGIELPERAHPGGVIRSSTPDASSTA